MPSPINITFLGTGSGIPTISRHNPAILLKYQGDYLLFDCGEACQIALQKIKVSPVRIKRIFITHWHADHFAGLLPLIETLHLSNRKEPLEVYGPEASRFVDAIVELSYWGIGFEIKPINVNLEEVEKIYSDEYEIYSIPVKHSVPAVGYLFKEKDHWKIDMKKAKKYGLQGKILSDLKEVGGIKFKNKIIKIEDIGFMKKGRKIIYSGDTEPCKKLFKLAKDSLMIHDSTFIEPFPERPHSSAVEIAKLAKEYKVKKLVLTHFSKRYKTISLKTIKPIFKNTVAAKDLMKINF